MPCQCSLVAGQHRLTQGNAALHGLLLMETKVAQADANLTVLTLSKVFALRFLMRINGSFGHNGVQARARFDPASVHSFYQWHAVVPTQAPCDIASLSLSLQGQSCL